MKRFRHTRFKGMLEDPKGEWIKRKEAIQEIDGMLSQWRALHSELSDERMKSFLILWLLSLSILGNCIQLIYHLNA